MWVSGQYWWGGWLDWLILEVFSNLHHSMILVILGQIALKLYLLHDKPRENFFYVAPERFESITDSTVTSLPVSRKPKFEMLLSSLHARICFPMLKELRPAPSSLLVAPIPLDQPWCEVLTMRALP